MCLKLGRSPGRNQKRRALRCTENQTDGDSRKQSSDSAHDSISENEIVGVASRKETLGGPEN